MPSVVWAATVALGLGGPAAIAAIGVADSKANTATTRLRASIRWKPSVMGRRRGSAIPRHGGDDFSKHARGELRPRHPHHDRENVCDRSVGEGFGQGEAGESVDRVADKTHQDQRWCNEKHREDYEGPKPSRTVAGGASSSTSGAGGVSL